MVDVLTRPLKRPTKAPEPGRAAISSRLARLSRKPGHATLYALGVLVPEAVAAIVAMNQAKQPIW